METNDRPFYMCYVLHHGHKISMLHFASDKTWCNSSQPSTCDVTILLHNNNAVRNHSVKTVIHQRSATTPRPGATNYSLQSPHCCHAIFPLSHTGNMDFICYLHSPCSHAVFLQAVVYHTHGWAGLQKKCPGFNHICHISIGGSFDVWSTYYKLGAMVFGDSRTEGACCGNCAGI